MEKDLAKAQRRALLDDQSPHNRNEMALLAGRTHGLQANPHDLVAEFLHHDFYRRQSAANALISQGPYALPALKQALTHESYLSRSWASYVIRKGHLFSSAILKSLDDLKDDDMNDEIRKALASYQRTRS